MYLVTGATGRVGSATVQTLLEEKQPVRVLVRSAEKEAEFRAKGCDAIVGDVGDRRSLDAATRGVIGIASMLGTPRSPTTRHGDYIRIELEGNRRLIEAARESGEQPRFVYLSGLLVERLPPIPMFSAKVQTEATLRESGLPFTVLRPTLYMETLAEDFIQDGTARLAGRLPHPVSLVATRDVGAAAAYCLGRPDLMGRTIELFGPEKMGYEEAIEVFAKEAGAPVRVRRMPLFAFRIASLVLGIRQPMLRVVYQLVRGLNEHDWSGDASALRDLLGREPTTLAHFARGGR